MNYFLSLQIKILTMENNKPTQEIEQMKRKSDGSNIYPKTITEAVFDKESGIQLNDMIKSFNCVYLPQLQIPNVQDNLFGTRCLIPHKFRRPMMFVTRLDLNNKLVLEYYTSQCIEDHEWGNNKNWQKLIDDNGNAVIVKTSEIQGDTLTFEESINQLWIEKSDGNKSKAGQPLTYFKMVPNEGKNYFTLYGTKNPDCSTWSDEKWHNEGTFLGEVTNLLKVWKYFDSMDSAMEDISNIPDSGIIAIKNGDNWDLYAKENNTYIRLGGLSVSVSGAVKTADFEDNINNDDQPATCKAIVDYFNSIKYDRVLDPVIMTELMFSQSSAKVAPQMTTKGLYSSVLNALPADRAFISDNNKKIGTHGSASMFSNDNGTGVSINQNSSVAINEDNKVFAVKTRNNTSSSTSAMSFNNGLLKPLVSLDTQYKIDQEGDYFYSSLPFVVDIQLPISIPDSVFEDTTNNQLRYKVDIKDENSNVVYSIFSYQVYNRNNQKVNIPKLFFGKSKMIYVCVTLYFTVKEKFTLSGGASLEYNVYTVGDESNTGKISCYYHTHGTEVNPDYVQTPEIKTDKINGKDIESIGGFDLFKLQKELLVQQRMLNIPGFVNGTEEKLFTIENGIQIIPSVEYVLYKFTARRTTSKGNFIDTDSIFDSCPIADAGNNISSIKNNLVCRKKPKITDSGYITLSIEDETFFPMVRTGVDLPNTKVFENTNGNTFYNVFFEIKGVLGGKPVCDEIKLENTVDYDCHEHTFTTNGGLTEYGDHVTITAKIIFIKIQS